MTKQPFFRGNETVSIKMRVCLFPVCMAMQVVPYVSWMGHERLNPRTITEMGEMIIYFNATNNS
jgi:hypothetical protein